MLAFARQTAWCVCVGVTVATAACAAPRDPELERRVIKARIEAEKGPPEPSTPPPSSPNTSTAKVATTEIKPYSGADVSKILGAVPGAGATLVAAFETDGGTLTCELDKEAAPQTVANFVALATGQTAWKATASAASSEAPFYDGLPFYRVVPEYLIEAGKPAGGIGPGWRIEPERGGDALFQQAGVMAMLADGNAINGSRFFILARPDKGLAGKYTAFGVCNEIDLVKRLSNVELVPGQKDTPKAPTLIKKLRVYRAE